MVQLKARARRARYGVALAAGLLSAQLVQGEARDFEKDIRPLVEKYCFECHNTEKTKGDLNLARFENAVMVGDSLAIWQRVGKRMQDFEMPPGKSLQPTLLERATLVDWARNLKENEADCNKIANEETVSWYPGYVMSRRLNRGEYENTIRDLLGVEHDFVAMFPADGAGGEGFDNNGNALFLSAIQIEKYLAAADFAVEQFFSEKRGGRKGKTEEAGAGAERLAAARDALLGVAPEPGRDRASQRAAAQTILEHFVGRAWRRPAETAEVDRLVALYDEARDGRRKHDEAIAYAMKAVLVSPNFLFLPEPEPGQPGTYALGDYPLASRMSYFLWGTMPDETLLELASEGKLQDTDELRRQVARMLADPKAAGLGELFAAQWLGVTQLAETARPDEKRFPEFDEALRDSMKTEVAMFFQRIVSENRSLLELIDANYTYANQRLASVYGIEGVQGNAMQLVAVNQEQRGGVLGMAAVLTATSHPLRTSAVLRGKWVLEQILGDRVPPPPPNVPQLPEDEAHSEDGMTLRQRLEAHRANPECAGCHARMDPIGFGLENYDPIGRWRIEQGGQPVDSMGVLPSGETFSGPVELKALLKTRKDDFIRNLTRKMLGYALGRSLTKYDNCVVDDCMALLQADDYRAANLFTQIVLSYPFRHRYSASAT